MNKWRDKQRYGEEMNYITLYYIKYMNNSMEWDIMLCYATNT